MNEKTARKILVALLLGLPYIIYAGNRLWDIRIESVIRDVVKAECLK